MVLILVEVGETADESRAVYSVLCIFVWFIPMINQTERE